MNKVIVYLLLITLSCAQLTGKRGNGVTIFMDEIEEEAPNVENNENIEIEEHNVNDVNNENIENNENVENKENNENMENKELNNFEIPLSELGYLNSEEWEALPGFSWNDENIFNPDSVDASAILNNLGWDDWSDDTVATNAGNFLNGLANGLLKDQINGIKDLSQLPDDFGTTLNSWNNVEWNNGESIQNAIGATAKMISDSWDGVNGATGGALTDSAEDAITTFATTINPVAGLVVGAGFATYNLYENAEDVADKINNLAEGFMKGDWTQVGEAFGGLIHDAVEIHSSAKSGGDDADAGDGAKEFLALDVKNFSAYSSFSTLD